MFGDDGTLDARQQRIIALGLVLLSVLAFLPALYGGLVWDDQIITDGPLLRTLGGLRAIWLDPLQINNEFHYWPLFYSTLWLEHLLWGDAPVGFHATNVLLHALDGILLWQLLRRLRVPGALVAAALFCLHPVHVEAVAWIFGRKDLLATAFYLGAALCYLRFDAGASRRWYAAALLLFGCALLSKSVALSLPFALAFVLWWQRGALTRRDGWRLLPLFGLAMCYAALDFWFVHQHPTLRFELTLIDRLAIAGRAIWFYAAKLAWPAGLTTIYPRWTTPVAAWQLIWPLTALAVPVALYALRHRLGRGACCAVCCFGITLAPVLGLVDFDFMRYAFVADRYQYLASAALIALAVAAGSRLAAAQPVLKKPLIGVAAIVAALYALASFVHARDYRDMETLFRANVARNPEAWAPYGHVGYGAAMAGRLEEAIGWYRQALARNPDDAWTHFGIAGALSRSGQRDAAIEHLQRGLELKPRSAEGHTNLGVLLSERGEVSAAVQHFERAIELAPQSTYAYINLGALLAEQGRSDEALALYRRAIEIDPTQAMAHTNLALALSRSGHRDEALAHYQIALERDPQLAEAWHGLGVLQLELRNLRAAIELLGRAVELRPEWPDAHNDLGNALGGSGQFERAASEHGRVLALDASYPRIHFSLALDLMNLGRDSDALDHLQQALQRDRSLATLYPTLAQQAEQNNQPAQAALFRRALESLPAAVSAPAATAPAR